jgi:hypothetical protein
MMLARYVIDILNHTTSTCIVGCLIEADLLGYMAGTYLSFIDMSYDVLLEAYFMDILVHAFDTWLDRILGHVVGELMR